MILHIQEITQISDFTRSSGYVDMYKCRSGVILQEADISTKDINFYRSTPDIGVIVINRKM